MRSAPVALRPCAWCEVEFRPSPANLRAGRGRFCSKSCGQHGRYGSATKRFWAKVNRNGPVSSHRPDLGPCWEWTKGQRGAGYGSFRLDGRPQRAHCVAYEWANGPVPDGMELDHLCRNRICVRPSHLEAVTHRENLLRGEGFAALNARRTHCHAGHPFDETNTYIDRRGERVCRTCAREQKHRSAEREPAGSAP